MQATQARASAPVEVSWSPPSGETATITGYRIFYGNRQSILVPSYVTCIILNFTESEDELAQAVSIHSESVVLPSELINVVITGEF